MKLLSSKLALFLSVFAIVTLSAKADVLVEDHFDAAKKAGRDLAAGRGKWKMADGVATCTQDDELYKKNKNHGPIMWYQAAFTDGTIHFSVKPQDCKQFVFTLNDDKGHVFRFVQNATGLSVRCWAMPGGHEAKPTVLNDKSLKTPAMKQGEWTDVELKFAGKKCTLKVSPDFQHTFENDAIAKAKAKLGLGFSFGTVSIKDVKITVPAEK